MNKVQRLNGYGDCKIILQFLRYSLDRLLRAKLKYPEMDGVIANHLRN